MVCGRAGHVHRARPPRPTRRRPGPGRRSPPQRGDVVDDRGRPGQGSSATLGLGRVDRDRDRQPRRQRLDDREDPAQLLVQRDRLRPRAGSTRLRCRAGLLPRRPGRAHARPRPRRSRSAAAVGEAVGRDVDDPHHPGNAGPATIVRSRASQRVIAVSSVAGERVPAPALRQGRAEVISGRRRSTTAAPSYRRSEWRGSGSPGRRRSWSIHQLPDEVDRLGDDDGGRLSASVGGLWIQTTHG